ncbi:MAG: HIT domain-containing protein [Candidatus Paceibacterota bacterium]
MEEKLINMNNAREENQRLRMQMSQENKVCIFCEKGLKEIHKLPILHQNKTFLVTDNAFPYSGTNHHVLIIPKKHISNVEEIDIDSWVDLKEMIDWVVEERKIPGASLFLRFGDSRFTCSSLSHLHFQIIVGNSSQEEQKENREVLSVPLGWKKK